MDNNNDPGKKISDLFLYLAPVPILALAAVILALHLIVPRHPAPGLSMEAPLLLFILNTVFLFVVSAIVAYVAMRSYLLSGAPTILLLGCGVLILGTGALLAGWLSGRAEPNVNIVVFNVSALFSAILHTAGSTVNLERTAPDVSPSSRRRKLAAGTLGSILLVVLLAWAAVAGLLPRFVQGKEPTTARQVVLVCTLALFAVSSSFIMARFIRNRSRFLYLYALALALLALNMLSFFLARVTADPIIWAGRGARYLAGVYFLLAVASAIREAGVRGINLDRAIADLFSRSRVYWYDILASMSDAVVSCDHRRRILQWNQAAEKIFGYAHAEVIGKDLNLVLPGMHAIQAGVDADQAVNLSGIEIDLMRKDQTILRAEVSISARSFSAGEIVTLVIRDVTERRRAEAALKELNEKLEQRVAERTAALAESEEKHRSSFASAAIGLAITTPDGRFVEANPAYCRLTGYAIDELRGLRFPQLIHPEDSAENMRQIDRMLSGQIADFVIENRYVRKGGDVVSIRKSVSLVRAADGVPRWIISLIEDITERVRAEKALRESERRFRLALRNAPVSVAAQDRELRYIWAYNQRTANPEEILGHPDADIFAPEEAARLGEIKRRVIEEDVVIRRQMWFHRPGGRIFLDVCFEPLHDESGRVTGVGSATVDLTPIKLAEEALQQRTIELRRLAETLEQRVQERTDALSSALKTLELRNKELRDFAFVASHDMREPLRKIQMFGDRISTRYHGMLPEEGRDYLARMRNAASRMDQLLDSLLAYSRISTRGSSFVPVDLTELAREAAADLKMIEERGGKVELGELPVAEVDSPQIRQLFGNLIQNGIKFNNSPHPEIRIHGETGDGLCRIFVRDNGIGFDERYLGKIFAPFQRLHARNEYEGMGMGLAICQRIVERHGGTIAASSKPGEGSTFIVTLPVRQPPTAEG